MTERVEQESRLTKERPLSERMRLDDFVWRADRLIQKARYADEVARLETELEEARRAMNGALHWLTGWSYTDEEGREHWVDVDPYRAGEVLSRALSQPDTDTGKDAEG